LNSLQQQRGKKINNKEFDNPSKVDALLDYLNSIEILNRQSLPCAQIRGLKNILIKNDQFHESDFSFNEEVIAAWMSEVIESEKRRKGRLTTFSAMTNIYTKS
jgi:hypothetical protein